MQRSREKRGARTGMPRSEGNTDQFRYRGRRVRVTDPTTQMARVGLVERTLQGLAGPVYEVRYFSGIERTKAHEIVEWADDR